MIYEEKYALSKEICDDMISWFDNKILYGNTGVNYSIGRGIPKDLEKAIYWYQRASEQGHSKAPFNIAIFYSDGVHIDPEPELAIEYFSLAESRGNLAAKKFLNELKRLEKMPIEKALIKLCCPDPLSHAMAKN